MVFGYFDIECLGGIEQMAKDCYEDIRTIIEDAMTKSHVTRGMSDVSDGWVRFCDWDLWGYVWPDRGAEGYLLLDAHSPFDKTDDSTRQEILCQIDDAGEVGKVEYCCDLAIGDGSNEGIVKQAFVRGVVDAPSWWDDMFE